jgi:hypothetical protein
VLEGGRSVAKTEGHNHEFEGAKPSSEGSLPLVSVCYPDVEVTDAEVDLGIDLRSSGTVQEVGDEGQGVAVLFGEFVKALVVDTKTKATILLANKKNRSTCGRTGGLDPTFLQVLVDKLLESHLLSDGQGVNTTNRRGSSTFKVNPVITRASQRHTLGLLFTKDIGVVVIGFGDALLKNGPGGTPSKGSGNRATGVSELASERAEARSIKDCAPSCLLPRRNAAAETREMCGFGTGAGGSGRGAWGGEGDNVRGGDA